MNTGNTMDRQDQHAAPATGSAAPHDTAGDPAVDENQIIAERRAKLAALREGSAVPFPNDFVPAHRAGTLLAEHDQQTREQLEALDLQEADRTCMGMPFDERVRMMVDHAHEVKRASSVSRLTPPRTERFGSFWSRPASRFSLRTQARMDTTWRSFSFVLEVTSYFSMKARLRRTIFSSVRPSVVRVVP